MTEQESHAVTGKWHDAAVIFDRYVSNMINKDPRQIVCCEAERSAILATAWLLV